MARHFRLPTVIAVALALVACRRHSSEREAPPAEAGAPTLRSAAVPAGGADAGTEAAADASDVVRVTPFGAVVADAGDDRGATGTRVAPGSQAASVLRPGDVITAVDLVRVRSADELGRYLDTKKGGVVLLTIERQGTSAYVIVTP